MLPQSQHRPPRNSSKVNLLISLVLHGVVAAVLAFLAAREGLLAQADQEDCGRNGEGETPGKTEGTGEAQTRAAQGWDDSVRAALAATPRVSRAPPPSFPPRIVLRFDVQEVTETINP